MEFIDLHGHYAWNIDDGIDSQENAKKVLKKARLQGIKEIVATPHVTCGKTTCEELDKIMMRIDELKQLSKGYGVRVYSGCELMLNRNVVDAMDHNIFIPIENTKYLLCEYDVRKINSDFIEVFDSYVQEIIVRGYKPIVAHVERYFHEEIDLDYVRYLIDLGCVIQVNTTSILGVGSSIHHENAIKLLDEQLVHIIASDTHREEGIRSPNMKECYNYLANKGYQKKYIELLQYENPMRILNNKTILFPKFKKINFIHKLLRNIK